MAVLAPTAAAAAPMEAAAVAPMAAVAEVAALVADIEAIKQLLNCIHWYTCFAFPSASCCI